jgi:hypothetical protein
VAARLEHTAEHHQFQQLVRDFLQQNVVPAHENQRAHKVAIAVAVT